MTFLDLGHIRLHINAPHNSDIARSEAEFAKTLDELGLDYISSNEITVEIVLEN